MDCSKKKKKRWQTYKINLCKESCPTLCNPWTIAHQTPLSVEFSRWEYWSGLPLPIPGDLPNPGIKPKSLLSPALAGVFFTTVPQVLLLIQLSKWWFSENKNYLITCSTTSALSTCPNNWMKFSWRCRHLLTSIHLFLLSIFCTDTGPSQNLLYLGVLYWGRGSFLVIV